MAMPLFRQTGTRRPCKPARPAGLPARAFESLRGPGLRPAHRDRQALGHQSVWYSELVSFGSLALMTWSRGTSAE